MKKSRFTETQIVSILKQADAGAGQRSDEGSDRKKTVGPAQKREAVQYLVEVHARPLRRSCECVGLSRSAYYRPPLDWTIRDAELIASLARLVEDRPPQRPGRAMDGIEGGADQPRLVVGGNDEGQVTATGLRHGSIPRASGATIAQ